MVLKKFNSHTILLILICLKYINIIYKLENEYKFIKLHTWKVV